MAQYAFIHTKSFKLFPRIPFCSARASVLSSSPFLDFRPRKHVHSNTHRFSVWCRTTSSHNIKSYTNVSRSNKMTATAAPYIKDGSLTVNGKVMLTGVPSNVVVYPVVTDDGSSSSSAVFLGASSSVPSSRHVFGLGVLHSKKNATGRASEDYMPHEPTFQTLHVASVSFNSLLLGEVVVPDWDMFHSNHSTAEFHCAARALGGCPIYVSDKPGKHDFKILKKLVLHDGSILRAKCAGRPTRDCLFVGPVMDGKSLLKMWNLNKLTGVIGAFNCQGAGNWLMKQASESTQTALAPISGRVSPLDVEFLEDIAGETWTGDCAVYAFNTGGAVESCSFFEAAINVNARGSGLFGAYSSQKPSCCRVDKKDEVFSYSRENGFLTVSLHSDSSFKDIEIVY